jgi:hypothetical protein
LGSLDLVGFVERTGDKSMVPSDSKVGRAGLRVNSGGCDGRSRYSVRFRVGTEDNGGNSKVEVGDDERDFHGWPLSPVLEVLWRSSVTAESNQDLGQRPETTILKPQTSSSTRTTLAQHSRISHNIT